MRSGLLRLLHLREQTEAVEETMIGERVRFTKLARPGSATRAVSSFNLFQTPEGIADKMAESLGEASRVLEPSAGLGRLYRAVRRTADAHVVMVEQSATLCDELYRMTDGDPNIKLIQADFLQCGPERLGMFDGVIMNPPFKNGIDIKHIRAAWALTAPGGTLVSLCANGPRQRAKLGALVESVGGTWEVLDPGSFKSEGTNVSVAMIVITKGGC